jgi:hypothetical protein
VDEIVVAVDATGDSCVFDACAGIADRVLRVDSYMPEAVFGWLLHQCSGDWIFHLDGDEVPSAALLARLPELVADPRPMAVHLTRRWLWPDTRSYIISPPWLPDYQVRLLRNAPGLWRVHGRRHTGAAEVEAGDQKLLDLPIYHADLIVNPRETRELKAERHERDRPGHNADGFPVNGMYVPELYEPAVEPVPDDDRPLIEQVLAGRWRRSPRRPRRRPDLIDPAELSVMAESRAVPLDCLGARLSWPRRPDALRPGTKTRHEIVVENTGSEWWPRGPVKPEIRLGYRWFDPPATQTFGEGRAYFTEAVPPGAITRLMVELVAPEEAGVYLLEVDLLVEHVAWVGTGTRHLVSVRETDPVKHWQPGQVAGAYSRDAQDEAEAAS